MHKRSWFSTLILGFQMIFVAFGALVLVPILTGLQPCVALFTAGAGTLIFQWITKHKVPVFLASSFAFIAPIAFIVKKYGAENHQTGIAVAGGAIIIAGLLQLLISFAIHFFGMDAIHRLLPPIVVGPTIMVIGLSLATIAVDMASGKNLSLAKITQTNSTIYQLPDASSPMIASLVSGDTISIIEKSNKDWKKIKLKCGTTGYVKSNETSVIPQIYYIIVSFIALGTAIFVSVKGKGLLKVIPVLSGIITGYLTAWGLGLVNFFAVNATPWLKIPEFTFPQFELSAILYMLPVILAPTIEHFGDMMAISSIAEKDYLTDPGVHRTLAGDSIATMFAGFFGGPPNTTYSEVSGALALIRVFEPLLMTIAAVSAILLSFVGKLNAVLTTIPEPVMGGIMILLFGMIASIGISTLIKHQVDFSHTRNLIIASVILTMGIGQFVLSIGKFEIGRIGLAGIIGVILNLILPKEPSKEESS